ncbi:YijD family membrane protein [Vibrio rarus]|uniref:YijD family membrane protein n=1 Tax=Vibrio rarus TaxID=413403 RepID=UPI0021C49DFF|nr:YijD family membrane protein [Vibrio rarus]
MTDKKEAVSGKASLLLAVVCGMSGSALFSSLAIASYSFSIFPVICLILAVQAIYQNYLSKPVNEDFPLLGLGSFFIGFFGHTAFIKAQYPDAGTNFFSIIFTLVLLLWVGKKLGYLGR